MKWLLGLVILLTACAVIEPDLTPINEGGTMQITSPAFEHNEEVPKKYTCDGNDESPPLTITDVPANTSSLVLIMDDPDAPDPEKPKMTWDHWVVFNIPPGTESIREGENPPGIIGTNSWGTNKYGGPCPPIGKHRYIFKLYALKTTLDLDATANKKDVEKAMEGRILEKTELIGLYSK